MTQFDYVDLIDIAGGYPPESDGQLESDYQYDANGNRAARQPAPSTPTRNWGQAPIIVSNSAISLVIFGIIGACP